MELMFDIQGITLERGMQAILSDVSLTVRQGEVLVIIGPSGSGKSSLLRCLNRLEAIDGGSIRYNGQDIHELPILELRRRVGMVFQKTAVFEGTVADNIAYGPNLRKEQLGDDVIVELMTMVSLDDSLRDRDASELSGGQEQRLSIARALANQPTVLLLDEPTSALDPVVIHHLEEILLKLKAETGLTLIWVSHDVEQARRVADRVLMLAEGRVVRVDDVDAMLDPENGDPRVLAFARGEEQ